LWSQLVGAGTCSLVEGGKRFGNIQLF